MDTNILIAVGVALLAVILVIAIHNGIKGRSNAVRRSWSDVLAYERQKQQVLPKLEEIVGSYKEFEKGLLTGLTELRSTLGRLGAEPDAKALADAERLSAEVMRGMRVTLEAYPNLGAAGAVRDLMAQLVGLQKEVTAALSIFNRNIELYNTGLEVFPNSLVNALISRAKPITPFSDSAAEQAFEYKPGF